MRRGVHMVSTLFVDAVAERVIQVLVPWQCRSRCAASLPRFARSILEHRQCLYSPPARGRRVRNRAGVDQARSDLAERGQPHPCWAAASLVALLRAGQGTPRRHRLIGHLALRSGCTSPTLLVASARLRWPSRRDLAKEDASADRRGDWSDHPGELLPRARR